MRTLCFSLLLFTACGLPQGTPTSDPRTTEPGGGGTGTETCTPKTCAELNASCGSQSDGCGAMLECGGCTAPKVCVTSSGASHCKTPAPSCTDGKMNSDETDVDCGGSCGACAAGKVCKETADCAGACECSGDQCATKVCRAGTWVKRASMPTKRQGFAVAPATNGMIYAFGGSSSYIGDYGACLNATEAYSPVMNSWTTLKPMPAARCAVAAVQGPNGLIYVVGGADNLSSNGKNVYLYDPAADSWTTGPPLSTGRIGAGVGVSDGKVYVFGGLIPDGSLQGGVPTNVVETLVPGAAAWVTDPRTLTAPRGRLGFAAASDGSLYAFGGTTSKQSGDALVPGVLGWHTVADLPFEANRGSATMLGDRVFFLGGYTNGTWAFDRAAQTWERLTTAERPRFNMGLATSKDGRVFAIGGAPVAGANGENALGTVEEYVP
ncbi:MAG: hypothetical protein IT381_05420 [Deltaproteobacteria bacterium]|nr:hypothetical protein [Deltaproteobacteria bacterium]